MVRDAHALEHLEGAKGLRLYDWARIPLGKPTDPRWEHWVLVRRNQRDPSKRAYYFVFAPAGTTLAELADRTGIDRQGLEATVAEFNASAAEGRDPAFGKGSRAYNRYQGDALHGPNPCVAPIKDGPFYAIKLVIGDLGTYAGIKTDEHARALDANGQPIAGLYAAGNDMASIMGGNYPGAGITLGPALTFGYIAGRHLAEGSVMPTSAAKASGL